MRSSSSPGVPWWQARGSACYVDEVLRERFSDLLFSVKIDGREAFVYVLLEHQSTVDDSMGFRLLRYEVRIWERWQADHPGVVKLPVIVSVVLHHSEWSKRVLKAPTLDDVLGR
jgi:predicted transposase/invertase (TIGR01784 family)